MKYKNVFEYIAAEWLQMVGGVFIGFSLPVRDFLYVFSPLKDFIIFFPIGVLLIGISYYYKFIKYK